MALAGLFNVDKPLGISSHDVVNRVRRVIGMKRVGHAGTLDPLATGVLLLCVGQATRFVEYLVGHDKIYEAVIRLGQSTTTYDGEGVVVAEKPVIVSQEALEGALQSFQGQIEQVPPMFSAVKRAGKPLYLLARQGLELERPARQVRIEQIELLGWELPLVTVRVRCSAGTYIRTLAHDLGQLLGCGGHLAALRRTAVGDFAIAQAVPLDQLATQTIQQWLLPMDLAVHHLPRLEISAAEALWLQQGRRLPYRTADVITPLAAIYAQNRFRGVVQPSADGWQPHKMIGLAEESICENIS